MDRASAIKYINSMIITCQTDAQKYAYAELRDEAGQNVNTKWIAPGVGLAERTFAPFTKQPIFIRHICPAEVLIPFGGDAVALAREYATKRLADYAGHDGTTCAVQQRTLEPVDASSKSLILDELNAAIDDTSIPKARGTPTVAVSVAFTKAGAYIGVSVTRDNLSPWAGGARPFAKTNDMICRSEFKLLEAVEVFEGLSERIHGDALDIGAAPGGWSRVLHERGVNVAAVDPAKLDPRMPIGVKHFAQTAERFIAAQEDGSYDIITNDMKMDAKLSADVMLNAARLLRDGGVAVVTLKLPNGDWAKAASFALHKLSKLYDIIGARQLFHNRQEITCALEVR